MAADGDEADGAAERLEAALERIARVAGRVSRADGPGRAEFGEQIAPRLDALIARLRAALGEPA